MHLLYCVLLIIIPVVYTKCYAKYCDVPSSDNSSKGPSEKQTCYFCLFQKLADATTIGIPGDSSEIKFVNCRFGTYKKDIVYREDTVRMLWVENSVESIEDAAFKDYKEAHFISFARNNISGLPDFVFQGPPNLDKVDFSWNRIVKIGENVFTGAPSITELNLAHNRIESFCIKQLVNLKIINLEYNLITVLSEIPTTLYEANFGFNRLTKIAKSTFDNMKLLRTLWLQWNNITEIESEAFIGIQRLQYVDLSFNNLTISDVIDGPNLGRMDFTGNQIVEFNVTVTNDVISLVDLILRQNKITSISYKCTFSDCHFSSYIYLDLSQNSIEQLDKLNINLDIIIVIWDLSRNKIKTIPTGFFEGYYIGALNLSTNTITHLKIGCFFGLLLLEHLDLSHNRIEYLNESIFADTTVLKTLNLSNNHITNLNGYKVIGTTQLNLIELDGNQFSCPDLVNLIEQFLNETVQVVAGSNRGADNINGIQCRKPQEIAGEHSISTVGIVAIILCVFIIICILTYVIYFKKIRQPFATEEDDFLL